MFVLRSERSASDLGTFVFDMQPPGLSGPGMRAPNEELAMSKLDTGFAPEKAVDSISDVLSGKA